MLPTDWIRITDLPRFRSSVLRWYRKHGRDLPWRNIDDPYRVWISEIMLQQTQVSSVLERYERFVSLFPTIEALARAKESEVLHAWQGLGYYARARNLHRASRIIQAEHGGVFPGDISAIRRLPGLGRYTANAVASFALGQRVGILEANTIRLWTRLCAASGDPAKAPLNEQLWQLAEEVLPVRKFADFGQALMDLGSEVCTSREPSCDRCPLRSFCQAYRTGRMKNFPRTAKQSPPVCVDHVSVVLHSSRRVLLHQRPAKGRWGGLWEFPTLERIAPKRWKTVARMALRSVTDAAFTLGAERMEFRHSIMHYRVRLKCFDAFLTNGQPIESADRCRWVAIDELEHLPFGSPQRRIAESVSSKQ